MKLNSKTIGIFSVKQNSYSNQTKKEEKYEKTERYSTGIVVG